MAIPMIYPKTHGGHMGWNSWDPLWHHRHQAEVLANARLWPTTSRTPAGTPDHRCGWFDPNAHAHGYSDGSPLCIDGYGRQIPDEQRFPSASTARDSARSPMRCTDSA